MMIASQDFETNSLTVGVDSSDDATSFPNIEGIAFDGSGLGWTASISSSPIVGNDSGDLIGVVNSSVLNGPGASTASSPNNLRDATNISGNWFHVADSDGVVSIAFDTIDTTGFTDLMLEFSWANNASSYEGSDVFEVFVNGSTEFVRSGDDLETGAQIDSFDTVSLDLSAFDGQAIDLVFSIVNSASNEDIGFDNVALSGTMVPEPASFACFAIGLGLTFARRRRR
ncbi:MAG: PEP-CTERM sorting domain-containing protein [Planctomycetota bacterium]